MKVSWNKIYFILFGLIDLAALIYDFSHHLTDFANHISYFTILSNIFTIVLFFYLGFRKNTKRSHDSVHGAIVIYMLITGIIYNLLLASTSNGDAFPIVNLIYHKLMPVIVLLSWFLYPPQKALKYHNAFTWLFFPLLYLAYTLIRGSLTGWYPYAFVDPGQNNGYEGVFMFSFILVIASFVGSVIIIALGNWLQKMKIRILH